MLRLLRAHAPDAGAWTWSEVGADGTVLRQAVFLERLPLAAPDPPGPAIDGCAGGAATAVSVEDRERVRNEYGARGVAFYDAIQGTAVAVQADAVDVSQADFDRVWEHAARQRRFTRHTTGPLPVGTRLTGTVTSVPWGPGITGLFVDIGSVSDAFMDLLSVRRPAEQWPEVGDILAVEVVAVNLYLWSSPWRETRIQVQLALIGGIAARAVNGHPSETG
ncbi:hypothetical protein [Nocardia sp. NPDC057353]|uniref:hypothetical protein n=1 Tax=Nocardia sp. NPDC057353 TaxID=3346104 RepID=UPI0036302283